jgi:phosphatidylserine decarboxylase
MIARGSTEIVFAPMLIGVAVSTLGIFFDSRTFYVIGGLLILVSVFFMVFFRDPLRKIGRGIVSPADGKVVDVDRRKGRISIFMGVQNVHVNRSPIDGTVLKLKRFRGAHKPAFNKDSDRNERVETLMRTRLGEVRIIQIAGIVARRIVPYIRPGIRLRKGQRIGIIRLGSRVDLYLPRTVNIISEVGDKVYAGTSQIGEVRDEMD